MEEIVESIVNGQRRQAIEQLKESSYEFEDLIEELIDNNKAEEILTMFRIAVNVGYIKFGN